ncbi:hypothetical protein Nos7524_1714 [Nostoc sp. PCC 7524]|nr:hypothetical protein Nos7524_1714 [Nostoc sp. PCC 7524]
MGANVVKKYRFIPYSDMKTEWLMAINIGANYPLV